MQLAISEVPMGIKNSSLVYGSIAKSLHWSTAVLIFVSYVAIYYREWFAESDFENWLTIQLHISIGLTLSVIIILRIICRCMGLISTHHTSNRLPYILARMVHFALYLILVVMPVSGYLSIADYLSKGGEINFFFIYDMTWFVGIEIGDLIGVGVQELEKLGAGIHHFTGKWIVVFLVMLHILAALYHHFILKNNVYRNTS